MRRAVLVAIGSLPAVRLRHDADPHRLRDRRVALERARRRRLDCRREVRASEASGLRSESVQVHVRGEQPGAAQPVGVHG